MPLRAVHVRSFVGDDGERWTVHEHRRLMAVGGDELPPVLLFERGSELHWVHCFPSDWMELTDDELGALGASF